MLLRTDRGRGRQLIVPNIAFWTDKKLDPKSSSQTSKTAPSPRPNSMLLKDGSFYSSKKHSKTPPSPRPNSMRGQRPRVPNVASWTEKTLAPKCSSQASEAAPSPLTFASDFACLLPLPGSYSCSLLACFCPCSFSLFSCSLLLLPFLCFLLASVLPLADKLLETCCLYYLLQCAPPCHRQGSADSCSCSLCRVPSSLTRSPCRPSLFPLAPSLAFYSIPLPSAGVGEFYHAVYTMHPKLIFSGPTQSNLIHLIESNVITLSLLILLYMGIRSLPHRLRPWTWKFFRPELSGDKNGMG